MSNQDERIELTTVSTPFDAEWMVGALQAVGVPAFCPDLEDSSRLTEGTLRILVHEAHAQSGRDALDLIRDEASHGFRDYQRPRSDKLKSVLVVVLGVTTVIFAVLFLDSYVSEDPRYDISWEDDRWVYRWKNSDELAAVYIDEDGNGAYETNEQYDTTGRLTSRSYDRNENGVHELVIYFIRGSERERQYDSDEDSIVERVDYPPVDGVQERWFDTDEDGEWDRHETVQVDGGAVTFVEVLDAEGNWVAEESK